MTQAEIGNGSSARRFLFRERAESPAAISLPVPAAATLSVNATATPRRANAGHSP
jgi:hypothetical protein